MSGLVHRGQQGLVEVKAALGHERHEDRVQRPKIAICAC